MTIGARYGEADANPEADGASTARGIHGQMIWIDPKAELVIVLRVAPTGCELAAPGPGVAASV